MRLLLGLACAGLLTACSQSEQTEAAASSPTGPAPSASSQQTSTGAPSAPSGGLQADVSALSASTSGLNVRITDTSTIVDLAADALFAFDSAELTEEAAGSLLKTADLIRAGGPGDVAIVGHTDSKGDDAYNQDLSERRAAAVADWMRQQVGVRQRTFIVSGKGETSPLAPNTRPDGADDPENRARNRRVEVTIPKA